MKRLLFLLIPLITLYAQVIDTVIHFSDEPFELLYIPEGNELYVNFRRNNYFLVLDCSTYTIKKTISRPAGYEGSAYGVWNERRNKIYYTFNPRPDSIAVVDNRTDSIMKWINYNTHWLPCYNSRDDKIYVFGQGSVAVIDCETDSIIKIITQPYHISGFVLWDSIGNKVYCGSGLFSGDTKVTAINCANDSVIAVIRTNVEYPLAAAYNSQRRKLYVGSYFSDIGAVIDAINDTLIKNFYSIIASLEVPLIWNSLEDKVYWPNDGYTMHIINCQHDSIIKNVELSGFIDCMCLPTWSNRLYVSTDAGDFNILYVLDCCNDSVISQLRFGKNAQAMTCNPIDQRIYITDQGDSALYVIRDEIPGIEEERQTLDTERIMPDIYPNPVKSVLRIRVPLSIRTIEIFDVSGKLVKALDVTSAQSHKQEIKISLKGISPGIYFLPLGTEVKKFLVVK